jgi:hypothetical protein
VRRSYRHDLGRPLHPHNAGQLQWGRPYRDFHEAAWREAVRVLRPDGRLVLNISDHRRAGRLVEVTAWHTECLVGLGLTLDCDVPVATRRLRYGANADARAEAEHVLTFLDPSAGGRS